MNLPVIFAIIEFSHLSTFTKYFHFCIFTSSRVIFCMTFSFFGTKNIITFFAKENT